VASLSQGRTAAAQCGLFTYKSVPVIFEPPCIYLFYFLLDLINLFVLCVCVCVCACICACAHAHFADVFVISQVFTFFTKQKVMVLCYCWAWLVVWCLVFVACRLLLNHWVVTVAFAPEHSNRTVGCKKTWSQKHHLMSMRSVFMSCISFRLMPAVLAHCSCFYQ